MQETRGSRPAPRLVAAAAFALFAANAAHAVDWTGYMRGGPAATTVSGESRQCYGLAGPGLKYRLGNECDFYGEFQLAQAVKADGVDFNAVLMTNYYSPQTESNSNYGIEQAYVEMKGVDIAPQALFWMGKRRDRDDVHIVDTFFVNMSGVGAGVENIDVGFGKFGFSGYKTDSGAVRNDDGSLSTTAHNNGGARLHAQLYDIAVNPDGKLRVVATYSKSDSQGGIKGTNGFGLSAEHVQDKFFGGGNHIWLQYAQGATNINQGFGNLTAATGNKTWRIVESPSWQIGAFGGQAIALYQHDEYDGGGSVKSMSIGGRGSYALTKNLKFLTEIGYSNRKPDGGSSENLTKITIGPALSTGPDFWKRPELRLYVTYADFNKAAAQDLQNGLPTNKTNGVSYGAQVEIWF
ncbi:MAG: carbohydrate porin [Pseudomonadota bacterium]|nr:carbohydrate porin [Pseudomonadota bacterium]